MLIFKYIYCFVDLCYLAGSWGGSWSLNLLFFIYLQWAIIGNSQVILVFSEKMLNSSANSLFPVCVSLVTELDDPDSGTLQMQMDPLGDSWRGHLGKCPAPKHQWENSRDSTLTLKMLKELWCKVMDLGRRPTLLLLLLVIFGLLRSGLMKRKSKS